MELGINWILRYGEVLCVMKVVWGSFGVVKVKYKKLCWAGYVDRTVIK